MRFLQGLAWSSFKNGRFCSALRGRRPGPKLEIGWKKSSDREARDLSVIPGPVTKSLTRT